MRACATTWVLGLVLAAMLGCSASAMKATPIWDDDFARAEGPVENRVNVWPLLYYREPALSVLWPLFSNTDVGQELVPLYAYDRGTKALRVGSLFPWLPAAAQLEPDYTRVLSVISDRKRDTFAVLPLYYGNPDGFWTPPLTRFRKGDRKVDGLLFPAALHIQDTDEESWHVAWPLLATWRDGEERGVRALPLFWSQRSPTWSLLNVGGLLFHRSVEPRSTDTFWLWPLGAAKRDGELRSSRFLPLWYRKDAPDESLFLSLPYQVLRDGERTWQSAFGLAHRIQDRDGSGHALLPLYWRYKGLSTQTLFTLAGGYSSGPDSELLDVLGPVFWSHRKNDTRTTGVLWPLLRHTSDHTERETRLLLGLAGVGSKESGGSHFNLWAYPLLDYHRGPRLTSFWSPPLSVERSIYEREAAEAHLRSNLEKNRGRERRQARLEIDVSSLEVGAVLGMAGAKRTEILSGHLDDADEINLVPFTRRESWLRPGWLLPVWSRTSDPRESSTELLWRFYDSRTQLRPDGQTYARQRILWRLLHRERLGTRHSVDVFPFVAYDRDENLLQWSFMGGLIGWRHAGDERVARVLWIPLRRSP